MRSVRLHVITNDEIIARPAFMENATSMMRSCGSSIAMHVRSKRTTVRSMFATVEALSRVSAGTATPLLVNDRIDVALAAGAAGVQLGIMSVPVSAARTMAPRLSVGYSAHSAAEARQAAEDGAGFILLGTIWPSASHPGECTAGIEMVGDATSQVAVPVYAIGGVTVSRSQEAILAGAHGVAVISGVWDAADPTAAVLEYLDAMESA